MDIRRSIDLTSRRESIPLARRLVADVMETMSFSPEDVLRFELAVEEACTNVVLHAYGEGLGPLRVSVEAFKDRLTVTLEDEGLLFDPTEVFPVPEDPEQRSFPVGRWGIPLIRAFSDDISYQRRDGKNVLRLTKRSNR